MEHIQVNLHLTQRVLMSMNDLIDNVYLPDFDKRQNSDRDAYQL